MRQSMSGVKLRVGETSAERAVRKQKREREREREKVAKRKAREREREGRKEGADKSDANSVHIYLQKRYV